MSLSSAPVASERAIGGRRRTGWHEPPRRPGLGGSALLLASCCALGFGAPKTAAADPSASTHAVRASAAGSDRITEPREPCARIHPLRHPWFGDTHVHTAFSQDASTQGTRNTPRDAYAFARGERLGLQPYDASGLPTRFAKLERPLDFVAVTDHAEQLGEVHLCNTPGAPGYDAWVCRVYRRWPRLAFFVMNAKATVGRSRWGFCGEDAVHCLEAAHTVWDEIQAAAEGAYDRTSACRFTSFVGYEWTGAEGTGKNLHRNVIFRNQAVPELPTSFIEAGTASALWDRLQADCLDADTGCDVLAIPHNSNLSAGLMFLSALAVGEPITAAETPRRARFEPLLEVMQHKGDSECAFSAEDELCGFEKLPYDNFGSKFTPWVLGQSEPSPSNFVRHALKRGLALEESLGANPFKFGLVASTDTHLAAPGLVEEEDYPGHGGAGAPAQAEEATGFPDDLEFNPGGLAVLWAEQNTRDALFAAMRRREAYGTSGTRLVVRFFGGWRYPDDLCAQPENVARAYAEGVPMGGDLPTRSGDAPRFLVSALQDPGSERRPGTSLERIQIVKGWLENGSVHERVHDVVRGPDGASLDLSTCRPGGEGARALCSLWTDPDFDPAQRAFYYARVVENPSCRWTQWLCNARAVDCGEPASIGPDLEACCSPERQPTIRERAWTSPIWYTP